MKTSRKAVLALTWILGFCLVAVAGDQDCGTVKSGGKIAAGYYAGAGGSSADAVAQLLANMGISDPTCKVLTCVLPATGCEASTSVKYRDDTVSITWGLVGPDLSGIYSVAAHVTSGTRWDKICTTCGISEPN